MKCRCSEQTFPNEMRLIWFHYLIPAVDSESDNSEPVFFTCLDIINIQGCLSDLIGMKYICSVVVLSSTVYQCRLFQFPRLSRWIMVGFHFILEKVTSSIKKVKRIYIRYFFLLTKVTSLLMSLWLPVTVN